jgi:pSer/pThr/pTyr-binding forkhead associated (FHA) protein
MKSTIKIGRDESNDIVINEPRISRNHAIIKDIGNGYYEIKDLNSANGTFVNGNRIIESIISHTDKIEVAGCLVIWNTIFSNQNTKNQKSSIQEKPHAKILKTILIGSSQNCDIVINQSFISNHHAEISLLKNGNYFIHDLISSNGTFVNGVQIVSKNFTKTDLIKIANSELPENWYNHKNLKLHIFADHKWTWISSTSLVILLSLTFLLYIYRCEWFGLGCNYTSNQIYYKNVKSIVHIVHNYYYTIELNGIKYFVGKNKLFKITEANNSTDNLLPYNTIEGSGCFINSEGTILTSELITSPWLNKEEQNIMLKEVEDSKTIKNFSYKQNFTICGETHEIKWLANGLINNEQNYISAISSKICRETEILNCTLQSIKKELPQDAGIIKFKYNEEDEIHLNTTTIYFYSITKPLRYNTILSDTFYSVTENWDINRLLSFPINKSLPAITEGSIIINERSELIGNIQHNKVILLHQYYKQIKK